MYSVCPNPESGIRGSDTSSFRAHAKRHHCDPPITTTRANISVASLSIDGDLRHPARGGRTSEHTMKQSHSYSASQYVNEGGFPLSWMCRWCCLRNVSSGMKDEAEEYHMRNKPTPGKIIGRPAGRDAYHGQSAMSYQKQSREPTTAGESAPKP